MPREAQSSRRRTGGVRAQVVEQTRERQHGPSTRSQGRSRRMRSLFRLTSGSESASGESRKHSFVFAACAQEPSGSADDCAGRGSLDVGTESDLALLSLQTLLRGSAPA